MISLIGSMCVYCAEMGATIGPTRLGKFDHVLCQSILFGPSDPSPVFVGSISSIMSDLDFELIFIRWLNSSTGLLPLIIPPKRQPSRTLRVDQWMPLSLQRSLTKAGSWRKLGAGHRACYRAPKIWGAKGPRNGR